MHCVTGEAHELGHNMQISQIRIKYPPPLTGDRNSWSTYQDRSGENSNNIFPYHELWRYYRVFWAYDGLVEDGHMSNKDAFAALQSAYANLKSATDPTSYVVLNADCSVLASFGPTATETTPAQRHWSAVYSVGGYAPNNGHRMALYMQMVYLIARNPVGYKGLRLDEGWCIFTFLYQAQRQIDLWANTGNDTLWQSKRDSVGMGLFPRVGGGAGIPYTSAETVYSITGNDYLVVLVSFLTGRDWRPFFDLRGVVYSDLADKQVQAHLNSSLINATTTADFPFIAMGGANGIEMPPRDMSAPTVPLNGYSPWPNGGFSVLKCPGVLTSNNFTTPPSPAPSRQPTTSDTIIVMYGPYITGEVVVKDIKPLDSVNNVYLIYQGGLTKMVSDLGEGKYYSGPISAFNASNWSSYTSVGNNYRIKFTTPYPTAAPTIVSISHQ
jgi:hypothetical protein